MLSLTKQEAIILDFGCGTGEFTRVLASRFQVVGLDVDRFCAERCKTKDKNIDFILADIGFPPIRSKSIDIVVCASVLEHCLNLKNVLEGIGEILKVKGKMIVGYPIETKIFKLIWKRVSPLSYRYIDQSQVYWENPYTKKRQLYLQNPHTHKQDYKSIRNSLRKCFRVSQRRKLPFDFLPDSLSYYECLRLSE